MKRSFITFGLLVAAAFALTNCTQKESYAPVQEEVGETVPFSVIADLVADTKTYNQGMSTMWSEGDALKMSYTFEALGQTYTGDFKTPFVTAEGDGIFTGEIGFSDFVTSLGDLTGKMKFSAVYPYTEDGGIVIPKSTVQNGYNSTAHLAGANCPLYGDVEINLSIQDLLKGQISTSQILLNHASSIILVEVTNESLEPIVIERVSFGVGTDIKSSTVVEGGEELPVGEKASVYIVTEPCTINPGDGNIKFWVNDTPQEIVVENPVTLNAGKIKKMNFTYEGDFPELYVVADVAVEMTADRIVPSVKNLINYIYLKEWAQKLKEHEDIETLLQDVLVSVFALDLEAAYDLLGGLPGFERQVEIIGGEARWVEKVNYDVEDYLESYIEEIKNIDDISDLITILSKIEGYYKVSGLKDGILSGLGDLSDYVTDFTEIIEQYIPESDFLSSLAKLTAKEILESMADFSIVDLLEESVERPGSWSAKLLNYFFSKNEIRDKILDYVLEIVKQIEEDSKIEIDQSNEAAKQLGIYNAKMKALFEGPVAAQQAAEANFDLLNQQEIDKLNNGVWGIFRKILDLPTTENVFEDLQIMNVYDLLQQLADKVEENVTYDEGSYDVISAPTYETIPVLTPSELAALIAE